jgi:hypothetical protein
VAAHHRQAAPGSSPPITPLGAAARPSAPETPQPCSARDRDNCSVAYRVLEDEHREISGRNVRFITKASLEEITLCRVGAIRGTFARIVDADNEPAPRDGQRSDVLKIAAALKPLDYELRGFRRTLRQGLAACSKVVESWSPPAQSRTNEPEVGALLAAVRAARRAFR